MNRRFFKLIITLVLSITTLSSVRGAEVLPAWAGQVILEAQTSKGLMVEFDSEISPLAINKIHSWIIRLKDAEGQAVSGAAIEFIGGMPEHNHGLPTQPQVTNEIAPGVYLLEGIRFHMQGAWRIELNLDWDRLGSQVSDTAVIDFILE